MRHVTHYTLLFILILAFGLSERVRAQPDTHRGSGDEPNFASSLNQSGTVVYSEDFADDPGYAIAISDNVEGESEVFWDDVSRDFYAKASGSGDPFYAVGMSPVFPEVRPEDGFSVSFQFNPVAYTTRFGDSRRAPGLYFVEARETTNPREKIRALEFTAPHKNNAGQQFRLLSASGDEFISPIIPSLDEQYEVSFTYHPASQTVDIKVLRQDGSTFIDQRGVSMEITNLFDQVLIGEISDGGEQAAEIRVDDLEIRSNMTQPTPLPSPPSGITAEVSGNEVDLSWNASSGDNVAGYNVYRSTSSFSDIAQATKLNNQLVTETSYTDASVSRGTTYYYRLTAVDNEGNESDLSEQVSATPQDVSPPAPPTDLSASVSGEQVDLGWSANSESDVAGYNVYRSTVSFDATGSATKLNSSLITGTSYTDSDTELGTTYYYRVTAVDSDRNESGLSEEAAATPSAEEASFVNPIANPVITQYYANHSDADSDGTNEYHAGIDFDSADKDCSAVDCSIRAAASGTVTVYPDESETHDMGKVVIIDHPSLGLYTLYAHLASISVSDGQSVSAGEEIGVMGETGFATGVHLHFEVKDRSVLGAGRNNDEGPWAYTPQDPESAPAPSTLNKPGHPNWFGYHDPNLFLNEKVETFADPVPIEVLETPINVRDYPSTDSNLSLVITSIAARSDGKNPSFVAIRKVGNQWYQIHLSNDPSNESIMEGWSASGWIAGTLNGTVFSQTNESLPQVEIIPESARIYSQSSTSSSTLSFAYGADLRSRQRFVTFESTSSMHRIYLSQKSGEQDGWVSRDDVNALSQDLTPPAAPSGIAAEAITLEGTLGIEVNWNENAESDLAAYHLYRGDIADFDTTGARLKTLEAGQTAYADTSVIAGRTYYYQLTAVDNAGNESELSDETYAFVYSSDVPVSITYSFDDAAEAQDYRLVALPGAANRPLDGTLNGEAGINWQAFWDDGSENDYLVKFDGSDRFVFEPGVGFWLVTTGAWSVEETFSTVALSEDYRATVDLHEGWNIVSNPLDRDVPWGAIEAVNGENLQTLWQFDGGFVEADTFRSAKNGEAFYFLNDQDLDSLAVPYPGAPSYPGANGKKVFATTEAPSLLLAAYQADRRTSGIQVSLHPAAHSGLDAYDQFAPPGRFETATLRLRVPDGAPSKRLRYLAHEYRPLDGEGQSFDLTLTAKEGPVVLKALELDHVDGREVRLIDETTGRPYDLRATPSVTLHPGEEPMALTLAIGTQAFVEEETAKAAPDELKFLPNYPNPFRGQTTLEYALPEQATVRLTVYDILGRRMRVLARGEQRAGIHRIQWDGRTSTGQLVASGLYLVRLKAMGQQHVQKIILVR